MPADTDFIVQPMTDSESDLDQALRLLQEVFPRVPLTKSYLRWLYQDNPDGAVIGMNAFTPQQRLVGHYVVIPIRGYLPKENRVVGGALSLNTAVSDSARGRGLFVRLAEATYRDAQQRGRTFVMGVANANSTTGFVKHLGFRNYGPLDARVGFAPPAVLPAVDRAHEARGTCDYQRYWDSDSITWRLSNPVARYHRSRDRRCLFGTTYGFLNVILKTDGTMAAPFALPAGAERPCLFLGRRPDLSFAGKGYIDVPMRLRPSPLHLIFRALDDAFGPLPESPQCDALDFDAY